MPHGGGAFFETLRGSEEFLAAVLEVALLKCLMVEELLFEAMRGSVEFLAAVVLPRCLVVEELFFEALRGSAEPLAAALAVVLP